MALLIVFILSFKLFVSSILRLLYTIVIIHIIIPSVNNLNCIHVFETRGEMLLHNLNMAMRKTLMKSQEKNQHTRGGKLDVKGISNIIIIIEEGDASSKLAWLCVGRKSCSSGEDRDKSQVCARHKAATFCAHNVCYAREGIKRSRKQQNLRDLLWPKVKFLQILIFLICFRCKCFSRHIPNILLFAWKKGWNECLIFILSKRKLLSMFQITTSFRSWSFLIFRYV